MLQQSAVSAADAYSDPARTAALIDAVIAVTDRCAALAESGVAAGVIEEQDYSPILRAKEEAGLPEQVHEMASQVLRRLDQLAGAAKQPATAGAELAGQTSDD